MIRNGSGDTERKVLLGTQPIFAVRLRQPHDGGAITVEFDPDAVVLAATESMALTAVRADDSIDSIDSHRTTLTSGGALSTLKRVGVPGADFGAAFVMTEDAGHFPVSVLNIRGTDIILADPLPHGVEITAQEPATVRYATFTGTLPAAVSAAITTGTPIPWVVDYDTDFGGGVASPAAQQLRGVVHVRGQIFDTGLDHYSFGELMRGTIGADAVYGAQQDWTPQIDAAYLALVLWVRGNIDSLGSDREDSIDGGAFRLAHAYWAASFIERNAEARAELRAEAVQHAKAAAESLVETSPTTGIPEVREHGQRASLMFSASTPRTSSSATANYYVGRPV